MPAEKEQPEALTINRHSVTETRVTLKPEHIDVVGTEVMLAFGPQKSILVFDPPNWQKYCTATREAAAVLIELESREVYRQMIATGARSTIDGQNRLRIPQSHMARGELFDENAAVDILHIISDDCQWLELWPAKALSGPYDDADLYNRAYAKLVEGTKQRAEVGANAP